MKELVSINGEIFEPQKAKISVFDRGFLFGDAVYEVTRSYGRIFFQIEEHIERLFNSADNINMNLGKTQSQMIDHIYSIYKKLNLDDIYMRIQVSRGQGPIGMSPGLAKSVNEVIIMYPFQPSPQEHYTSGVTICVTERRRNSKRALDPNIKSGNYLNNVLAFIEGEKINAYETFMLNEQGNITEGTTSNIFCVKGRSLITPPASYDILRGITRKIVLSLAKNEGLKIEESGFPLDTLMDADEVFLTSSTREIMPISAINGVATKKSPGDVTTQLHKKYKRFIEDYCKNAQATHPWK
jgi:branched-chain amino acid aminotransferase